VVINIAEGARLHSSAEKTRTLDYAIGSTLECAACLDLAEIKGRLSAERLLVEKRRFLEVTRMLIGLRKTWRQSALTEEPISYRAGPSVPESEILFHHESLDIYRVGLDFVRWFVELPGGRALANRWCREVDKAATSVVLNVAEGNGRYSELDHRRFLEMAANSAVKVVAYLDLYQKKALPTRVETTPGRELMSRIVAMVSGFDG
jgi:four helix bundle protein